MVTNTPAVFTPLQCVHQGDVTAPNLIMESFDKLSDSVHITTPPSEQARFLSLEKHRQNWAICSAHQPADAFPLVLVMVELSLGITLAVAE